MEQANSLQIPVVSVVMIAYNKEAYLDDAIRGVVRQRLNGPIELIVMDDCSTDGTAKIAMRWAAEYPHIVKYFRNEKNLGLQGNYLEGFKKCTGRFMAICDADDYWCYRKKLQTMVNYMDSNPRCAVAFHRVINYYEETGEKSFSNGGMSTYTAIEHLSRSNYITNLSVLYRREAVDLANLPQWISEDKSPDYAMHMLYAAHGYIHFFKRPMGVYRKSSQGVWSMTDEFKRLEMSLKVRIHLMEEFKSRESVCAGLRAASLSILRAMGRCAASEQEMDELRGYVALLQTEVNFTEGRGNLKPQQKRLLSRLRGWVSRLLPLPRP